MSNVVVPSSVVCDVCRRELDRGEPYVSLYIGMDESPTLVGRPGHHQSIVESTVDLEVCVRDCEAKVRPLVDALLERLFELRAPDDLPDTVRNPREQP